jgi:hypothetical protein
MHAVVMGLPAGEIGGNHHAAMLRGDDHCGWGIGARWGKNLDLVDGSAIQPVTTFHWIPIMRISSIDSRPRRNRCAKKEKEQNANVTAMVLFH